MSVNIWKKGMTAAIILLFVMVCFVPASEVISAKVDHAGWKIIKNNTNMDYSDELSSGEYRLEKTNIMTIDNREYIVDTIENKWEKPVQPTPLLSMFNQQNGSILWMYSDGASIPVVSFCDNGNYIWVGQRVNNDRFQLFKTNGFGLPEWDYEIPVGYHIGEVDSSAKSDVLAGIVIDESMSSHDIIYKWNISSSTPSWAYELPDDLNPSRLRVSDDGARIVLAAIDDSQEIIKIIVFNSDSNVPSLIYPIHSTADYVYTLSLDISVDGSVILITHSSDASLIDINIPGLRWEGEYPAAISGDGSILVFNDYDYFGYILSVLEWNSLDDEYVHLWNNYWSSEDWLICPSCHTLEVSSDGSTIMIGGRNVDRLQNKVVMFDVKNGTPLWEYYTKGEGNYTNTVYDIRLSDEGTIGVVGYWGDELQTVPELNIFRRNNSKPFFSVDTPGSIESVDISPNGKFAVGGCKMVHANEMGHGGVIYAIDIAEDDPPNKPVNLSGTTSGVAGTHYVYTAITTDPDGDFIYYMFDWGDGTNSGWTGPYLSGVEGSSPHAWNSKGNYNVKVKAKDDPNGDGDLSDGAESAWSNLLPISMPKTSNPLFLRFFEKHPYLFPVLRQLLEV